MVERNTFHQYAKLGMPPCYLSASSVVSGGSTGNNVWPHSPQRHGQAFAEPLVEMPVLKTDIIGRAKKGSSNV